MFDQHIFRGLTASRQPTMAETAQLPSANPVELAVNATLQPPLSRCGHGPGLILLRPACYAGCQQDNKSLDPEPLQKWAEESFAVVQITIDVQSSKDLATLLALIKTAKDGLTALPECDQGKFGLIGMRFVIDGTFGTNGL